MSEDLSVWDRVTPFDVQDVSKAAHVECVESGDDTQVAQGSSSPIQSRPLQGSDSPRVVSRESWIRNMGQYYRNL